MAKIKVRVGKSNGSNGQSKKILVRPVYNQPKEDNRKITAKKGDKHSEVDVVLKNDTANSLGIEFKIEPKTIPSWAK